MELEILALVVATISLAMALWALRGRTGPPVLSVVEPPVSTPLDLAALKAEVLAELQPEVEVAVMNSGGCTKESHVWRKRPHLISGYEEVFYCKAGCGSTLRHRVK